MRPVHRQFRELLDNARGYSEFVIAANVDIRGFSDFSLGVDSAQSALFIRKVYAKLIDDHFADAAFVKPTGDGLLVIIGFEDNSEDLRAVTGSTVEHCLQIVDTFASITEDDPLVNFPVPDKIGIGLARGPVSRLASGDVTLDYSGSTLNLASRLMDLARPSGVVIDGDFGVNLLPDPMVDKFEKSEAYIRGISPNTPHEIYTTADVEIPTRYRQPLDEPRWESVTQDHTAKEIREKGPRWRIGLPGNPRDTNEIRCTVRHPGVRSSGRRHTGVMTQFDFEEVSFTLDAGKPVVVVRFDELAKRLAANRVKDPWSIRLTISYPRAD